MASRGLSQIRAEGPIAYVLLTQGYEAIVDVADVPLIRGFSWYVMTLRKGHTYAARRAAGTGSLVLMHREILGAPPGVPVDHEDGNGLNNRRKNIRLATFTLNNANVKVTKRNKLGIKGVSVEKSGRFSARIREGERRVYIGTFDTVQEASAAYFGAARLLWGEFAKK